MGLHIHSLDGLNENYERDYYIYLLDYGWDEPISEILRKNFNRMARMSSEHKKSVVIARTPDALHFNDEVLSWHNINGEDAEKNQLLPALLITNRHPAQFRKRYQGELEDDINFKMVIIPFRKISKDPTEVVTVIDKVFQDLKENKDLDDFQIAKELKKGVGKALADSFILEPNFYGVGFSFKKMKEYLKK
ncbi:MAG: hypothetical protein AAFX55_09085 [Bacteroidota bacterium]